MTQTYMTYQASVVNVAIEVGRVVDGGEIDKEESNLNDLFDLKTDLKISATCMRECSQSEEYKSSLIEPLLKLDHTMNSKPMNKEEMNHVERMLMKKEEKVR